MPSNYENEAQAVAALTQLDKTPHFIEPGSSPYVVIHGDAKVEDVERYLPHPVMTRRQVTMYDMPSFIAYLQQHGSPRSAVYAHEQTLKMICIIDEDTKDEPSWRKHTAVLQLQLSDAWKIWWGMNKKGMGQMTFAEFIEDNAVDVINPNPAEFMELAKALEVNRKTTYSSAARTQSGTIDLTYSNEDTTKAGGKLKISLPERFTIAIPVYQGDPTNVSIDARFRYRLSDDEGLKLSYDLYRPQDVLRAAWKAACEKISFDGKPLLYQGTPS